MSDKPNVVVILIDTLRSDCLGIYGRDPETAPFIAELAESSTVFTRAFSTSSWTAPSTASIFTSLYPHHHGVIQGIWAHAQHQIELERRGEALIKLNQLPDSVTTLSEHFKSLGYGTYGMASNPNLAEEVGFSRGFDRFVHEIDVPVETFYKKLRTWKREMRDEQPYFLYLHLNDVHAPYDVREPYHSRQAEWGQGVSTRYLSEIGYVDEYIKKIYKLFDIGHNTILYIISDHGEEFRDHGGSNHTAQLYRELNQVAAMIYAPSLGVATQRLDVNVSHVDVFPTMMDLIGESMPHESQGISLAPLLGVSSESRESLEKYLGERTLFAHRVVKEKPEDQHWAAIYKHWKYIRHVDKEPELFDHRNDLPELQNVAAANKAIAKSLDEQLNAFQKTSPDHGFTPTELLVDEELMEQLNAQGYVE